MEERGLAEHWLGALRRAAVLEGLEGVYAECAAAVGARGPACWGSGRCCNFEKHGHRLYVTGLEAAYCIARLEEVAGTRRENFGERSLRLVVLEEARGRGGCAFQVGNMCGVHGIKPLGCRVYFCDRSAQGWQMELSERLIGRVRGIHDEFGIEYRYGEWGEMLGRFAM